VALPIYLTDELWVDKEKDIVGDEEAKALKEKANVGKKRKSLEGAAETEEAETISKKSRKVKSAKVAKVAKAPESNDTNLDAEIAERKAALKKQKKAAKKAVE
jgi:ribosome biogenesis protein UTP30